MFRALADLAHARSRRVVALAALVFVAAGFFGGGVAERLAPYGADDPDTESVQARERIEQASGMDADPGVIALVRTDAGVDTAAGRERVREVAEALRADEHVARVLSFEDGDRSLVSRDGRSTYLVAFLAPGGDDDEAADSLAERFRETPGVTLGGPDIAQAEIGETVEEDLVRAEVLAFPLLFLLSLWFFRSLVAALLPLLVGGLSIVLTFVGLTLVNESVDLSIFALNLVTGLGLGLAIDYSLFVVSRYREEVAEHGAGREALHRTLQTAGRTVLFSSLTVAAALASLIIFPQRFLYSMGIGGAMVSLIAAVVALVVLPAVLAMLGERVNALSPRWLRRAVERDSRPDQAGAWYRLSRFVMRRPARVAVASAAILVALGIPFLQIQWTSVDASVLPEDEPSRVVYDALRSDFPIDRSSPLSLVVQGTPAVARAVAEQAQGLPGVKSVSEPRALDERTARIDVVSAGDELADRSQDLVREIRDLDTGAPVQVGGRTAEFVDLKASLADHLPYALALIAVATIVVLFLMTGSVILPLKALLMNVLTLSATLGLLVLIFQDGRLEGLLDYTSQGALETTQPLVLFAVAFGLSTDYGVFLLSRIKEARDAGMPNRESVAVGLERTGRIVTAAALLFCVAMGAFATSQIIFIKQLGLGTALAVIIDATLVRALLVPALMELLGRWNWWAPRPLRRVYERFGLRETRSVAT